jgi:hypothetical protein
MVDANGPLHMASARDCPQNLQVLSRLLHWHNDAFSNAGALAYTDLADKVKGGTPLRIAAAEGATL